ncbi:hypothetical protein GcM1_183032 [Golovinomyces cichoracearum]|uniref:Uncharacterized protein n=1 Tax=Golovinomyces cichoracearum TaxID=62708 RepID=A0A420J3Q3_9PEZI|nr:hypothetical protein GcM1_183032 [Golovinomyces cichoracearum]
MATSSQNSCRAETTALSLTSSNNINRLASSLAQIMEKILANDNRMGVSQPAITQPESQRGYSPDSDRKEIRSSEIRKRRNFSSWDGEKRNFYSFIHELQDRIEIDRDLMGTNRAVGTILTSPYQSSQRTRFQTLTLQGQQ